MPTYELTSPDGQRFEVTAPDGATQDQVLAFAQANYQDATKRQQRSQIQATGQATEQQLIAALRRADAAQDVPAARAIARRIQDMRTGVQPGAGPDPSTIKWDDQGIDPDAVVWDEEGPAAHAAQKTPQPRFNGQPVGGRFGGVPVDQGPWTKYQQPKDGPWSRYQGAQAASSGANPFDQFDPPAQPNPFDRFDNAPPQQVAPAGGLGRDVAMGARSVIQGAGGLIGSLGGDAFNHYLVPGQQPSYRNAAAGVADKLGLPTPQTARERVMGDVGEGLTGTGLTMGAGGVLSALASRAGSVAANPLGALARLLTAQPVSQVASTAAGTAAASTTREGGGGTGAQLLAGLAGGMAPGGAGLLTPFVRSQGAIPSAVAGATRAAVRGRDPAAMRQAVGDFAAAGTTPSVGQATGNRFAQAIETLTGNVPGGAGRMERFGQQQGRDVSARMDQIAAGLSPRGATVTPEQVGRTIAQGIEGPGGFMDRFRGQSSQLYGELDSAIPRGTPVQAKNAASYLAQQSSPIAGAGATSALLSNPKLAGIRQALESDLAAGNGVIPYEALARVRSRVGEMISDAGLLTDIPTRQLRALYGSLSEDMRAAATAAGPKAVHAFNRANNHFKFGTGRLESVEHVIEKNGGPEKIYSAAFGGINNGATTLRAVMQSLDKPGQRELTASFIRRMGRANSGHQNAVGDVFSMETFLSNWDRVSPEAKRALFDRHGLGFSSQMDKIARMAERVRDGSKVFRNPSGTARQGALMQAGGTALFGAGQLATGNVTGALITLATSVGSALTANRMARLMTNPKAVAWLASNTTKPSGELLGQLQTLRQVAERDGDPELAALADDLSQQARQNR